jgi:hypothetical protein
MDQLYKGSMTRRKWCEWEDVLLKSIEPDALNNTNISWVHLHEIILSSRSPDAIRNRWNRMHNRTRSNGSRSKHTPWIPQEDDLLCRLKNDGHTWTDMTCHFPSRSKRAIRGRWERLQIFKTMHHL